MCRLSGRGRAALCAAAVSAGTGVLLDAKTFLLGDGQDDGSAAAASVTDWLAGLPDGAVVAVASGGGGGGGPHKGSAGLDAGLAEAVAKLVGDNSSSNSNPNSAEGKPTGVDSSAPTKGFTLVGSKSATPQNWARCQHRGTQDGNAGRCAVYAELVVPPAPADLVENPATLQIELRDKLALCPLRSVPGDNDDAPSARASVALSAPGVRGLCRREGEPTVSVGPALDLVDCPGWTTTVLKAPEEAGATDDAEKKGSPAPAAWRVATVRPAVGGTHEDTEEFDDGPVG